MGCVYFYWFKKYPMEYGRLTMSKKHALLCRIYRRVCGPSLAGSCDFDASQWTTDFYPIRQLLVQPSKGKQNRFLTHTHTIGQRNGDVIQKTCFEEFALICCLWFWVRHCAWYAVLARRKISSFANTPVSVLITSCALTSASSRLHTRQIGTVILPLCSSFLLAGR